MRVEAQTRVAGDPESVWRWWTDYGEAGEVARIGHGVGSTVRRVVAREPGRVVLEDRALGGLATLRHDVELDEERLRIHERATRPLAYESWWKFEPEAGGTRIRRVVEMRTGLAEGMRGVVARVAQSFLQRDLEAHVRRMAEDLRVVS